MKITGVVVNGMPLIIPDNRSTTGYFKAFMNYCIQNFPVLNNESNFLRKHFKSDPNHPEFRQAIHYKRIVGYNGIYYSTYSNNERKKMIMEEIARELGIGLLILSR